MQKERKVLTAFRWQSDGWAGRLEGKCSRGLLSGHTRAPFNKVQRWAAPQHIAGEWEEGEWGWREGWAKAHAFFFFFFLSLTTCHACETGIPHMCMGAEIGNPQPGQALKRIQRSGGVPAIICSDTLTPLSLHEGMIELEEMHCIFYFFIFFSAVPTVCNVRSDHSLVVIQPYSSTREKQADMYRGWGQVEIINVSKCRMCLILNTDACEANTYKDLDKPCSECYHTSCISHLHAALRNKQCFSHGCTVETLTGPL